jgi:hypothetical protein
MVGTTGSTGAAFGRDLPAAAASEPIARRHSRTELR